MKTSKFFLTAVMVLAFCLVLVRPVGAATIADQVKGKILLQVQQHGEAWYVNPLNLKRYYLGRPTDAFNLMRSLGLGITDADLAKIPTDTSKETGDLALRNRLSGRILLQVQQHGEAWYVNPANKKRYFLGRPADAFNVMRNLGLGITDSNLYQIQAYLGENGFIKSIESIDGKYYVNIDYIEIFSRNSDAGINAQIEDGVCLNATDCVAPPGIYIRNNNSLIRRFEISAYAILKVASYKKSDNSYTFNCSDIGVPQMRNVSVEELREYIGYLNQTESTLIYFNIGLSADNKIIEISEMAQCLP